VSPTLLGSEALFAGELPPGCLESLDRIRRLQELSAAGGKGHEEARAVYAALMQGLSALEQEAPPPDLPAPKELGRRWSEAVLLWMHFCQTSSVPLIDSVGDRSLGAYPVDLPPDPQAFARLRAALESSMGQSPAELREAERNVAHLASVLPLKASITSALEQRIEAAGGVNGGALLALLREFYGPLPWRPSDVDFVLTTTAAFFVLPLEGDRLDVADWEQRPEAERQAISAFLQRLGRANKAETWRFPAFGLFDPAFLDRGLVDELATTCGVRAELIEKTLATMVSVLPKDEVEQYLVHDAWGHTWQEVLNEFEWEYALVREIAKPLSPGDGPRFGGENTAPLREAFVVEQGTTQLDEQRLLQSVEADLRGRVQAGLSVALSELFADLVEAKYSRLNPAQGLPSSSLLAQHTLKFDLTIGDVMRQARRVAKPYRELSNPEQQARFAAELAALGLPEAGLATAVQNMVSAIARHFEPALRPELGPAGDPRSTVAARALLKLALITRELERVLDETHASRPTPAWTQPTTCPDLWAVGLSHVYEADRARHFWCLDWLVRGPLRAHCDALGRALGAAP
jgi:hypothetical protein